MQTVRFAVASIAVTSILAFTPLVHAQGAQTFKARLSPMPVDASTQAATTGLGSATAVLTGNKLAITGTFSGLQGPATIARIHVGQKGISGPPALDLMVTNATSGTIKGDVTLTSPQVDQLKRGRLYIQIHSEKAPDGNLRGWLLQ